MIGCLRIDPAMLRAAFSTPRRSSCFARARLTSGKLEKAAARTYDATIAATAIANGPPAFTCNPGDFEGVDGLEVIAVPVSRNT